MANSLSNSGPREQSLGAICADLAMRGAAEYLRRWNIQQYDEAALIDAIRRHSIAALRPALDDAKQAYDCHMSQAAEATFSLTMRIAGVKAAQEVCGGVHS